MQNRVKDFTMAKANKTDLEFFSVNGDMSLAHTNRYIYGGDSELIHRG